MSDEQLARQLASGGSGTGNGSGGGGGMAAHPAAQAFNSGILGMLGLNPQELLAQQRMMQNRQYIPNNGGGGGFDPQSGVRAADAAYREQLLPSNYDATGQNNRRVQARDRMKYVIYY